MKKRKDGRYVLTRVIDGKSVTVYGKTKEEVYNKLETRKREKERSKTFSELVELWKDAKWDSFAYGTQNCYRSALMRAVDDFGDVPNDEVTPQMVQRLIDEMIAQNYSAKSVKTQKNSYINCIPICNHPKTSYGKSSYCMHNSPWTS